jgi:hypothetical protein
MSEQSLLEDVEDFLPKPPKQGYRTEPPWNELRRMTRHELTSVHDFAIINEYGSVHFIDPVDVTFCDLARLVEITPTSVEIYPDD